MTWRHALSWKTAFYDGVLPALRALPPAYADRLLGLLGRASVVWTRAGRERQRVVAIAKASLGATAWEESAVTRALTGNVARFLARDYPLEGLTTAEFEHRFDVQGEEHLAAARASGRGVILLGCHFGAYLAAVHWIYRREIPLRLLVQRPRHVSPYLQARFDEEAADELAPQSSFFLRRNLPGVEATQRMLRAHTALRRGTAVYLSGDIPWGSSNARRGTLLGHERTFLAVWTDLAVLARAPVVPVFCRHQPDGRYGLSFDSPWVLEPGDEVDAVRRYLRLLESQVIAHPADAVAHLTWPCYTTPPQPAVSGPLQPTKRKRAGTYEYQANI